ncbi:hypothetical protein D0Z00_001493 [Geotrichum galactomycetum]|uniref:Uncharacterized protein n=1 Tax=Geotrichum galactomycetum TaxID=27317 RepID=A0ACB6V6U0_9ASCO|nr:hypothetical protein D0Z00_001493 [Geotrichum candidum]
MALKPKTNINNLRTPNRNAKSNDVHNSIKKPTSDKKHVQVRVSKYPVPRSPPPKKLTVFSDCQRKPAMVLGTSVASPATPASTSKLGLKRPKMLVFKETTHVLDQAAALVNAKVNELRDKENIPPPDLHKTNENPLETPKKRFLAPKGVKRKPLSILLDDDDTDDENSVQEDNNDGHFVVLQSSLAPSPGKELSDDEGLDETEEPAEAPPPFRTPTRATPKKKLLESMRKPKSNGPASAKKKKVVKPTSPLADSTQKLQKKKKRKGISLIR